MHKANIQDMSKLTPRRAEFVRQYIKSLNAAGAARAAGYAPSSANTEGSRLLANADVQHAISEARAQLAEREQVTPERIVSELASIAFSDLGDYFRLDGKNASIDFSNLPIGATKALESITVDEYVEGRGDNAQNVRRIRVRLHDKRAALVDLAKTLGMFSDGVNVQVNVNESDQLQEFDVEQLRELVAGAESASIPEDLSE